jgi:prolyl-tRNA synthetase
MVKKFKKEQLVKRSENFSKWYTEIILKAGLADYAPIKGCMVIRPYGFAIWENIQKFLDQEIKKAGVKNAYFPIFIPESFLNKEKEHVQGFSPELAVVTIGGGKKLQEKLIVRPTSETIIYQMYSKWIKSWRDLPLLINQWANIVRWEKRAYLFLRTTEFLWQEGHTAHQGHEQAEKEVKRALDVYVNLYRKVFAIDGISNKKSEAEKFPGALDTYTYEMLMPDNKALQGCTSHDLGQNFSKVFDIKFLDKDKKEKFVWQTCWGFSTRSIGALIMSHSDDNGLILPPLLAPIQVIVMPIFQGKKTDIQLEKMSKKIKETLKDFRVEIDLRKEYSIGWKFNEWEMKGVPLRIEVGPIELKTKKLTLTRRDNNKKQSVSFGLLNSKVKKIMESIQEDLFLKSRKHLKENTREVSNYQEFKDIMKKKKGFLKAFWCESLECERKIKEETKATTRCLFNLETTKQKKCIYCSKKAKSQWVFGQAY